MIIRRLTWGILLFGLTAGIAMAADKKDEKKKEGPPPPDPALTECVVPFRPAVVLDGRTATEEQMVALAARVRRYQTQLNTYRACLEPTMSAAEKAGDRARDDEVIKKYNDSVTAEQEVVDAYNKILAAHRAAQKSSPPAG